MNARNTLHGEGMGGDFHHHVSATFLSHTEKEFVQFAALRGGKLRMNFLLPDAVAVRTNQGNLFSLHVFQNMFDQMCRSCLSAGSGNPDNTHSAGRIAEKRSTDQCQRFSGIGDLDKGEFPLRRFFAQNRGSTCCQRCRNKTVPVKRKAADGDKQIPLFCHT